MHTLPLTGTLPSVADRSPSHPRLTDPPSAHSHLFSSASAHDVTDLTEMFGAHLEEEFERTGRLAMGLPVAGFLHTIMLSWAKHSAGFAALDVRRGSLELLYVRPPFRGLGIAGAVVRHLSAVSAAPLALKAPLSPAGQALAERHGLRVAHSTVSEAADSERAVSALTQHIRATCRHRSTPGAPGRLCPRCCRKYARRYAERVTQTFARSDQNAQRLLGR